MQKRWKQILVLHLTLRFQLVYNEVRILGSVMQVIMSQFVHNKVRQRSRRKRTRKLLETPQKYHT